jgi:RNA polymerase sigma-70 factor (ECF subfamily)
VTREEEAEIIKRVLSGEAEAFEPLVEANQALVYNLALKMLANPEDAYDMAQEAFLKAFRSLSGFKMQSSFSSWLYRITANICLDFLRKNKRRQETPLAVSDGEDEERELELPDYRYSPETELERKELRAALDRAVAALSAEQRSVFLLREINGLSYAEISSCLELDIGTVKSRLFRARSNLAKLIGRSGNFS